MSTTPPEVPTPAPTPAKAPPAEAPAEHVPVPGDWQPPVANVTTAPPPSAPVSSADVAADAKPDETISPTSFDVVADDGSTSKITPGYSHIPCPVCGNTTVKTANVAAATPLATLQGDTVNPGDQVVVCDTCSTTIAAGDHERYETDAKSGVYGDDIQAAAAGGVPATDVEVTPGTDTPADEQELAEFRAWKAQQTAAKLATPTTTTTTTEGGTGGHG